MALGLVGSLNVHLMQLTLCALLQALDVLNVFHDVQTSRGLLLTDTSSSLGPEASPHPPNKRKRSSHTGMLKPELTV